MKTDTVAAFVLIKRSHAKQFEFEETKVRSRDQDESCLDPHRPKGVAVFSLFLFLGETESAFELRNGNKADVPGQCPV